MRNFLLLFAIVLTISGCKLNENNQSKTQWEMTSSHDGKVYRLNKVTGDVDLIENGRFKKVRNDGRIDLTIGLQFQTENGKTLVYRGDGNFEPTKPGEWVEVGDGVRMRVKEQNE